jgi:hypothetical protein
MPRLAAAHRPRADPSKRAASFAAAFVEPPGDLLRRYGPTLIAVRALVAIYRLRDFVSGVMANPLYIDLGFTESDIATLSKLYGVWIGIAGAFGGGLAIARLGLMPSLILGGLAASSSHLTLALLAAHSASLPLLTLSVSVESFASGFAGAALCPLLPHNCGDRHPRGRAEPDGVADAWAGGSRGAGLSQAQPPPKSRAADFGLARPNRQHFRVPPVDLAGSEYRSRFL